MKILNKISLSSVYSVISNMVICNLNTSWLYKALYIILNFIIMLIVMAKTIDIKILKDSMDYAIDNNDVSIANSIFYKKNDLKSKITKKIYFNKMKKIETILIVNNLTGVI